MARTTAVMTRGEFCFYFILVGSCIHHLWQQRLANVFLTAPQDETKISLLKMRINSWQGIFWFEMFFIFVTVWCGGKRDVVWPVREKKTVCAVDSMLLKRHKRHSGPRPEINNVEEKYVFVAYFDDPIDVGNWMGEKTSKASNTFFVFAPHRRKIYNRKCWRVVCQQKRALSFLSGQWEAVGQWLQVGGRN